MKLAITYLKNTTEDCKKKVFSMGGGGGGGGGSTNNHPISLHFLFLQEKKLFHIYL